jgi:Macrocin-O-methyltransferase (TylF)/Coenzyme PQQ synthesis protein D (PqqD)
VTDLLYRTRPARAMTDEDGLYLESPETGEWLRLNESASAIWERFDYPATPAQAAAALAARFEAPAAEIESAVADLIARLEPHGLLAPAEPGDAGRERYLRLLKRALINQLYPELELQLLFLHSEDRSDLAGTELKRHLRDLGDREPEAFARLRALKAGGMALAACPHTMIGQFRLDNIERCAERIFADGIAGDFLEAGVCQGGATIFMRGLQVIHGEAQRRTWVVDSFQGVPPADQEQDRRYGLNLEEAREPWLAFSEARVREHFARYDLLDEGVEFVAGWVAESLPGAPIGPLAMLRLDVDLYSSTQECLDLLYDKVSPGGFILVDDYGWMESCRDAVDDFRARRAIADPIHIVDASGIFWRKGGGACR